MKQSKIYVKFIIICIALLMGFIGIFMVTDKIVKAEITQETPIKIEMPLTLSSEALQIINNISTSQNYIGSTTNIQGLLQAEINNNIYYLFNINGNNQTNSKGFNINFYQETNNNQNYYSVRYTYTNENWTYDIESISGNGELTTSDIFSNNWYYTQYGYTYLTQNNNWLGLENIIYQYVNDTIQIDTPITTTINNTITWSYVENAEYYNIYMGGNLIGQTEFNQWVVSANGNYTIQACTTLEGYSNSDISQVVQITSFNDLIGNGWNFYTLIGAVLDSELILVKAFLNYTVWGINLFQTLQIILTLCLVILIIKKFVVKG